MTISYQRDVASSTAGGFTRLLFKWKGLYSILQIQERGRVRLYMTIVQWKMIPDNCTGSLYKLICRELLLFLIVYSILGAVYREVMNPVQKRWHKDKYIVNLSVKEASPGFSRVWWDISTRSSLWSLSPSFSASTSPSSHLGGGSSSLPSPGRDRPSSDFLSMQFF